MTTNPNEQIDEARTGGEMSKYDELRRLAEAAKYGDWFKAGDLPWHDGKTGENHGLNVEDDRFIAAANPAAILALIAEVDRLTAENATLSNALFQAQEAAKSVTAENETLREERDEWHRLFDSAGLLAKNACADRDQAKAALQRQHESHRTTWTQLEQAKREIEVLKGVGRG